MKYILLVIFFLFSHVEITLAGDKISPLVDTAWLKQNLNADGQVMLDVRPKKTYSKGHIKGAVSAPYGKGWRKTIDGVIGMLPPEDEIVAHIRSFGVDNNERVIILPHGNSSTDFGAATRIYWTFKVLGHDKVSILDGGYKAWKASGGELSLDPILVSQGQFVAKFQSELLASERQVTTAIGQNVELVDARPLSQFVGKSKSPVVKRAGTIPTAANLQQSKLYDAKNASFADASTLATLSQSIGLRGENASIAFCNTGHWASIAWFAMSEIQGRANVSLYDGSMTEWTLDDKNQVQKAE